MARSPSELTAGPHRSFRLQAQFGPLDNLVPQELSDDDRVDIVSLQQPIAERTLACTLFRRGDLESESFRTRLP